MRGVTVRRDFTPDAGTFPTCHRGWGQDERRYDMYAAIEALDDINSTLSETVKRYNARRRA
jgi:hypothetical protein